MPGVQQRLECPRHLRWVALAAVSAILGCTGMETLEPSHVVRRLGGGTGYAKFEGVSKRSFIPGGDGPVAIDIVDLSASKIHFATALSASDSDREATGVRCDVHVFSSRESPKPVVSMELRAGTPHWVESTASLSPTSSGKLLLRCEGQGDPLPAVTWATPIAVPSDSRPAAPLIVLVSVDTLRADHVTGFGGAADLTPHIGKLGEEGLRFVATTSEGTWTLASHFSLLFSRLYGFPVETKPLTSLAQALADKGFLTAAFTGGGFMGAAFNYHLGFDHYAEYSTGKDDLQAVLGDVFSWIDRFGDAPCFVFLHTFAAHELAPQDVEWHKKHGHFSVFRPSSSQVETARRFYTSVVRKTDRGLAPLFHRMREISNVRPVLLVLMSDHGEAFGEHANYRHGYGDRSVTLHDEVTRVPLVVWGPHLVPPGRVSTRPTMLSDVAPSILAAVGASTPLSMRGSNLWPLWSGDARSEKQIGAVLDTPGSVSQTKGSWSLRGPLRKLIVTMLPHGGYRPELYDLNRDPKETRNIAPDYPDTVSKMAERLLQRLGDFGIQQETHDAGFPTCPYCEWGDNGTFWRLALDDESREKAGASMGVDTETLQRLRELGYVD